MSKDNILAERYKIIEKLGSGSMGEVYKAYDFKLNRTVALKKLSLKDKSNVKRFLLEAQATAQLNHPNLIKIYDIVYEQTQKFFTMEFIEGITLSDYLKKTKLDTSEIMLIMIKVAKGVSCAHKNGIVHRDLKPSNIMIDRNNNPIVMDFGIAKNLNKGLGFSKTGELIGTIRYMSPEQANGNHKVTNKRSDIYSLGAILYEMLAGVPIFPGKEGYELLYQIANANPPSPRKINPQIPKELEQICLKALAKSPKQRYRTVDSFLRDLKNFVALTTPRNNISKIAIVLLSILSLFLAVYAFAPAPIPKRIKNHIQIELPQDLQKNQMIEINHSTNPLVVQGSIAGKLQVDSVWLNNKAITWDFSSKKFRGEIKLHKGKNYLRLKVLYTNKHWDSLDRQVLLAPPAFASPSANYYRKLGKHKDKYSLIMKLIERFDSDKATLGILYQLICLTISIGAPIYDARREQTCYEVYHHVATSICHKFQSFHSSSMDTKHSIEILKSALKRSRTYKTYSQKAWALRFAFNQIKDKWISQYHCVKTLYHLSFMHLKQADFSEMEKALKIAFRVSKELDILDQYQHYKR